MRLTIVVHVTLVVGALVAAVFFSIPMLYAMAQIRGWLPGAEAEEVTIAWKDRRAARKQSEDDLYWVGWKDHRVSVTSAEWPELAVGDTIDIVWVSYLRSPQLRNGTFPTSEDFGTNLTFLAIELAVVVFMLFNLFKQMSYTAKMSSAGTSLAVEQDAGAYTPPSQEDAQPPVVAEYVSPERSAADKEALRRAILWAVAINAGIGLAMLIGALFK